MSTKISRISMTYILIVSLAKVVKLEQNDKVIAFNLMNKRIHCVIIYEYESQEKYFKVEFNTMELHCAYLKLLSTNKLLWYSIGEMSWERTTQN